MTVLAESPLAPIAEARAIVGDLNELATLIDAEGFDAHRETAHGLMVALKYAVEEVGGSLPVWVERQMDPSVKRAWSSFIAEHGLDVEEHVMVWIRTPDLGDIDPNLPLPI